MHPLLRQREILSGYLSGFIIIGLMIAFAVGVSAHLRWTEVLVLTFPLTVVLAVVCLSAWYLARSYDLKTTPDWRLVLTFLLAAMCASTVVMAFGHLWLWVLNHLITGIQERSRAAIPVLAAMCSLVYLLAIILHYLLVALESSQKAEILSREAELKALKAQVNPHFLFNSLNSISALTSIDPAKARQMCIALSDFLRQLASFGRASQHPAV